MLSWKLIDGLAHHTSMKRLRQTPLPTPKLRIVRQNWKPSPVKETELEVGSWRELSFPVEIRLTSQRKAKRFGYLILCDWPARSGWEAMEKGYRLNSFQGQVGGFHLKPAQASPTGERVRLFEGLNPTPGTRFRRSRSKL